jgi:hypothetical protein
MPLGDARPRHNSLVHRAVFAGENARTADLDAKRRAEELEAAGADQRAIWGETGWIRGTDQRWRFEIDDSQFGLTPRAEEGLAQPRPSAGPDNFPFLQRGTMTPHVSGKAGDLINHNALMNAYPALRDLPMGIREGPDVVDGEGYSGRYQIDPAFMELQNSQRGPRPEGHSTIQTGVHEFQHAVDDLEDFSYGGIPMKTVPPNMNARHVNAPLAVQAMPDVINELVQQKKLRPDQAKGPNFPMTVWRDLFRANYERSASEWWARMTAQRQGLNAEERRARFPYDDADLPPERAIVGQGYKADMRRK